MPQTLTTSQLQALKDAIAAGGVNAVADAYRILYENGYKYAGWAEGVATGDTLSGLFALNFLSASASDSGIILSQAQIDKIRTDMANQTIDMYMQIAKDNNGYLNQDLTYPQVSEIHGKVFKDNNLSLDNWTLNAPMETIRQLAGDKEMESIWELIRDTGGEGDQAIIADLMLMGFMDGVAHSSDPGMKEGMEALWQEYLENPTAFNPVEVGYIKGAMYSADAATREKAKKWVNDTDKTKKQILDNILRHLGKTDQAITDLLAPLRNLFRNSEQTMSPIILDLDGDGIETTAVLGSTHFDFAGDGFAESTGWASGDDGLLVLDRNGNGRVDDGGELFGNNTLLGNGQLAANGFAALAELDSNHDGRIDALDAEYGTLLVWRDLDGDGVSEDGELLSLQQAGVQSINLAYSTSGAVDQYGNTLKQTGSFTRTDGATGAATDVWFAVDTLYSQATEQVEIPPELLDLPNLSGAGYVRDLRQAMALDTTGQLEQLVRAYVAETDYTARTQSPQMYALAV